MLCTQEVRAEVVLGEVSPARWCWRVDLLFSEHKAMPLKLLHQRLSGDLGFIGAKFQFVSTFPESLNCFWRPLYHFATVWTALIQHSSNVKEHSSDLPPKSSHFQGLEL